MKPEKVKIPFSWENRKVLIQDRIWFVPDLINYETYQFDGWQDPNVFGNDRPVYLEYCSGNGSWIAGKAAMTQEINWVGVEKKFDRVQKIWSKLKKLNLSNLLVLYGEGFKATANYFPAESVSKIFINFPDPWPKTRHAKHRIIQTPFLDEMWRVLKPDGTVTFVTDDQNYSKWTIDIFCSHAGFKSLHDAPFYITEHQDYGTSYFEQLWREKGKTIRYHEFAKVL